VGDDDRAAAQRIVELADQLADDAHGDRVEAGEGLVVHHQQRVERDGPRQRDTAGHAAGQFGGHQVLRPAQAHGIQLQQHQVADHLLRQIGMLAHLEGDVVEHRDIGEQRAELEQHAHAAAHGVKIVGIQFVDDLAVEAHRTLGGLQLAADQAQRGGLAAAALAHDGHHLAARDGHVDPRQDRPPVVGEIQVADLDERLVRHERMFGNFELRILAERMRATMIMV
jgi:hypothetical protein